MIFNISVYIIQYIVEQWYKFSYLALETLVMVYPTAFTEEVPRVAVVRRPVQNRRGYDAGVRSFVPFSQRPVASEGETVPLTQ